MESVRPVVPVKAREELQKRFAELKDRSLQLLLDVQNVGKQPQALINQVDKDARASDELRTNDDLKRKVGEILNRHLFSQTEPSMALNDLIRGQPRIVILPPLGYQGHATRAFLEYRPVKGTGDDEQENSRNSPSQAEGMKHHCHHHEHYSINVLCVESDSVLVCVDSRTDHMINTYMTEFGEG
jgi:hypothetical protein